MALHSASRVSEPITVPMVWQISLKKLHDLVLSGGVGDEVVDVSDHVDADGAGELVLGLGGGEGGGDDGRDEEGELHPEFLGGLFVGLLWLLWVLEESPC